MADVRTALRELGDDADRVEVAMVTIDPDRDTPVLADYVSSFVEGGHTLATDDAGRPARRRRSVRRDAISSRPTPPARSRSPTPPQLYVVDDAGRLALTWQFGVAADDLADDLEQLLESA